MMSFSPQIEQDEVEKKNWSKQLKIGVSEELPLTR